MTPVRSSLDALLPRADDPVTPHCQTFSSLRAASPPPAPRTSEAPLLKCLKSKDVVKVRAYLAAEPEAISQYFWESDGFEPLLCVAIRLGCPPDMVELLSQYGADATACNKFGYSPLTLLASMPAESPEPSKPLFFERAIKSENAKQHIEVARLLIEAGADPQALDAKKRSAAVLAKEAGNTALANFLGHYRDVQACITLLRAKFSPQSPISLSGDVLHLVSVHLLPAGFEIVGCSTSDDPVTVRPQAD